MVMCEKTKNREGDSEADKDGKSDNEAEEDGIVAYKLSIVICFIRWAITDVWPVHSVLFWEHSTCLPLSLHQDMRPCTH